MSIKSANKNTQKNESDNLNKSPQNEIDVVMIKNGKNYYNVNISNIYKEKEKNMCYSKKDKIDCGINSKNEILKKIKIDNKSSQKKNSTYKQFK